jgi:hypothetical protein
MPEITRVVIMASILALPTPTKLPTKTFWVGSYIVCLKMFEDNWFHLLPQKSCKDVAKYGLLNSVTNSYLAMIDDRVLKLKERVKCG